MNAPKGQRHYRSEAKAGEFRCMIVAASIGLSLVFLFVAWCLLTHQSIIFYGS